MNVSILIPAYRPDSKLIELVEQLRSEGFRDLVVIDDGGGSEFSALFESLRDKATVLVHPHNRGKGAALKTGMAYLMEARPDEVGTITVDADGQHRLPDIRRVAQELLDHPQALILGVRSFTKAGVPLRSRLGNLVTRFVFWALVGKFVRDTQTGLRGIPQQVMPQLVRLRPDRYEYELEMLLACRRRSFRQVTIETVYLDENRSSHFNPVADSLKIYATLFRCRFQHFLQWLGMSPKTA
jgi:dolichol-phosphate mannosyltransferase